MRFNKPLSTLISKNEHNESNERLQKVSEYNILMRKVSKIILLDNTSLTWCVVQLHSSWYHFFMSYESLYIHKYIENVIKFDIKFRTDLTSI